jgi:metal-responsive CopG/Arc/MetJ family transcriptional regulator
MGISLRKELVCLIDEAIKTDPFCTSRADFVRDAVKEKLHSKKPGCH